MKIYLSLDRLLSDPRSRTVPRQTDLSPLKSTTSEEEEVELPTSSPDNHNSPPLTTGNIRLEAPESPSNLPSLAITVAVDGELPITVARRGPRSRVRRPVGSSFGFFVLASAALLLGAPRGVGFLLSSAATSSPATSLHQAPRARPSLALGAQRQPVPRRRQPARLLRRRWLSAACVGSGERASRTWRLTTYSSRGVDRAPPWNSGRPGRSHSARSVTLDREL